MSKLFYQIFSKFQCGFRKGLTTQNWDHYGALLTDLSKAFACIINA